MSYKVYKSQNYFVVHDTATSTDVIRQVRNLVRWEKIDSIYSFYWNTPNLTTVGNSIVRLGVFNFSDLVDSTGTAWSSEATLDLYLEQWTGHICCPTGTEVEITVNGEAFGTTDAGTTFNVPVKATDGDAVGSIVGVEWIVGDSEVTINGTSIADIPATDSLGIAVEFNGSPSGTWNAGTQTWEITGTAPTYATADVMKTGQTTSQVTYDDGYNEFGRLVDFFTLAENNAFGNTNRFTDTLGGQTYADNIILDHSTYNGTSRLAWYKGNYTTNSATLANACLNSHADAHGGFATWFVPNKKQQESILYHGGASGVKLLNYAPFNINLADDFWTCTNTPITPTTAVYVYQNYNYCVVTNGNMSYVAGKHVPCRYITDTELGI